MVQEPIYEIGSYLSIICDPLKFFFSKPITGPNIFGWNLLNIFILLVVIFMDGKVTNQQMNIKKYISQQNSLIFTHFIGER